MNNFYFSIILFFSLQAIGATEVGVVSSLKGDCFVTRADKKVPLVEGSSIYGEDRIETTKNAEVNILYDDNSMQTIASETAVVVKSVSDADEGSSYFTLAFGTLKSVVGKRKEKQKYEIEAGDVSLGIRGTALQVSLSESGQFQVIVFEGNVEATQIVSEKSLKDDNKTGTQGKSSTASKTFIGAGEKISSGKSVTPLSQKEKLEISQKSATEKVASIQSSNQAQSQSSSNEVAAVLNTIKQEILEITASNDAVKQSAAAIESKEDQLDKGRSLLINLNPSVKSLVTDLEDIR